MKDKQKVFQLLTYQSPSRKTMINTQIGTRIPARSFSSIVKKKERKKKRSLMVSKFVSFNCAKRPPDATRCVGRLARLLREKREEELRGRAVLFPSLRIWQLQQ